jgi:hypothetical protein
MLQLNIQTSPVPLKANKTRWSSVHKAIRRNVVELRAPIMTMLKNDQKKSKKQRVWHGTYPNLPDDEWEILQQVGDVLDPISDVTTILQASKRPSASDVLPYIQVRRGITLLVVK